MPARSGGAPGVPTSLPSPVPSIARTVGADTGAEKMIALDPVAAEAADHRELLLGLATPSATVFMPRLPASATTARMIAVLSGSSADIAWTKLRSILSVSNSALAQIAERGIAGAEIVHREAHAEALDLLQHLLGLVGQLQEHALGDLQLEPAAASSPAWVSADTRVTMKPGSRSWRGETLTAIADILGPVRPPRGRRCAAPTRRSGRACRSPRRSG